MGGTEYFSFELVLGILRGLGRGEGAPPGTVPLQNPQVTSRKACLRNADFGPFWVRFGPVSGPLGPFRVRFGCFGSGSGPFRGVGWGRGGVGQRAFCKGKNITNLRSCG